MMIIPYKADLSFARPPLITYLVMGLCVLIFYFQETNNREIESSAESFCEAIQDDTLDSEDVDHLRTDLNDCIDILVALHRQPNKDVIDTVIRETLDEDYHYSADRIETIMGYLHQHYERFHQTARRSLDARLMYAPDQWNPLKTITSALSHGGWGHLIGNLIFFFAFATAIETLFGNRWHFVGFMVVVALITDIAYSLSILFSGSIPIPTLGLSGVVSGVIGLSAFLMPKARIHSVVWFVFYLARSYPLPAWMLAVWFIGWDVYYLFAYTDNGGVNFLAHVSGGLAGYVYGRWFLKQRKEDTRDELADEIDFMKDRRTTLNRLASSYKGSDQLQQWQRERQARRDFASFNQRLYRLVTAGKNSEAIVLFLREYDHYRGSPEIFEELMQEMAKWRHCRALMCLGRLVITLLTEQQQYKRALIYAKNCLAIEGEFVLAEPGEALTLTIKAIEFQQYELAYQLIRDAEQRYGSYIDLTHARLLEARLLWLFLDQQAEAKQVMKRLINSRPNTHLEAIRSLATAMQQG